MTLAVESVLRQHTELVPVTTRGLPRRRRDDKSEVSAKSNAMGRDRPDSNQQV